MARKRSRFGAVASEHRKGFEFHTKAAATAAREAVAEAKAGHCRKALAKYRYAAGDAGAAHAEMLHSDLSLGKRPAQLNARLQKLDDAGEAIVRYCMRDISGRKRGRR